MQTFNLILLKRSLTQWMSLCTHLIIGRGFIGTSSKACSIFGSRVFVIAHSYSQTPYTEAESFSPVGRATDPGQVWNYCSNTWFGWPLSERCRRMFADSRRATDMPRPIKRSGWVNTSGAIKSDTVFYNRLHEHTEVPFHIAENPTDSKKQPSIFSRYICVNIHQ